MVDGIQYSHVLVVQRSLTVLRPSQAFHDATCEYRVMFAIFTIVVAYGTCTETCSRRDEMAPGTDGSVAVAKVYTGVADTWYISVYLLRRARRKLHFDTSRLGNL